MSCRALLVGENGFNLAASLGAKAVELGLLLFSQIQGFSRLRWQGLGGTNTCDQGQRNGCQAKVYEAKFLGKVSCVWMKNRQLVLAESLAAVSMVLV